MIRLSSALTPSAPTLKAAERNPKNRESHLVSRASRSAWALLTILVSGSIVLRSDTTTGSALAPPNSEMSPGRGPGLTSLTRRFACLAFPTSVTAGPAIALDFTRYTPSAADDEILLLSIAVNNPATAAGRTFGVRVPGIHGTPGA
jgi:hypothetical protein